MFAFNSSFGQEHTLDQSLQQIDLLLSWYEKLYVVVLHVEINRFQTENYVRMWDKDYGVCVSILSLSLYLFIYSLALMRGVSLETL
jgi:hypothetical protein